MQQAVGWCIAGLGLLILAYALIQEFWLSNKPKPPIIWYEIEFEDQIVGNFSTIEEVHEWILHNNARGIKISKKVFDARTGERLN